MPDIKCSPPTPMQPVQEQATMEKTEELPEDQMDTFTSLLDQEVTFREYKNFSYTKIRTVQIERFKFRTRYDGPLSFILFDVEHPLMLIYGEKRPWSSEAFEFFLLSPGSYQIGGDFEIDRSAPIATIRLTKETRIILDGSNVFCISRPGTASFEPDAARPTVEWEEE